MTDEFRPAVWSGKGTGKRSVKARETTPRPLEPAAPVAPAPPPAPIAPPPPPLLPPPEPEEPREVEATDAAKALAAQHNLDLADITGSGSDGRITKDDVAATLGIG